MPQGARKSLATASVRDRGSLTRYLRSAGAPGASVPSTVLATGRMASAKKLQDKRPQPIQDARQPLPEVNCPSPPKPVSTVPAYSESRSSPSPAPALMELRDLLQALPTRADLASQLAAIDERHARDMADLKASLSAMHRSISSLEQRQDTLEEMVAPLPARVTAHEVALRHLVLQVDDLENRNRRNNVKLRGLPEDLVGPRLLVVVRGILNRYLGEPEDCPLELDRTHRVAGPRPVDRSRPRDVLTRIHFFGKKEMILRRAWEKGPLEYEGTEISVLPDVSKRTLAMRRMLRPLLDLITESGGSYRWGHPFHLIIKKDGASFVVRSPRDLPGACSFLGARSVNLPDWTLPNPFLLPASNVSNPAPGPKLSDHPRDEAELSVPALK